MAERKLLFKKSASGLLKPTANALEVVAETISMKGGKPADTSSDEVLNEVTGRAFEKWWLEGSECTFKGKPYNAHIVHCNVRGFRYEADLRILLGQDAHRLGHNALLRLVAVIGPQKQSVSRCITAADYRELGAAYKAWNNDPRGKMLVTYLPLPSGKRIKNELDLRSNITMMLKWFAHWEKKKERGEEVESLNEYAGE